MNLTSDIQFLSDIQGVPANLAVPVSTIPSASDSRSVSYIGFTFSRRDLIESKLYYLPNNGGVRNLAPHLTNEHLQRLCELDARNQQLGCSLYDSSCLNASRFRVVWSVPYVTRKSQAALIDFLHKFHQSNAPEIPISEALQLNDLLEKMHISVVSSLFLIGGEIDQNGQFKSLKFDWDADIVYDADAQRSSTCYNNESALQISLQIIKNYVSEKELPEYQSMFSELFESGYYLHSWGMNLSQDSVDDVKVYFKSKSPHSITAEQLLCDFFQKKGIKDADSFRRVMQYFIDRSWPYVGFCLTFTKEGLKGVKSYVISPYRQ